MRQKIITLLILITSVFWSNAQNYTLQDKWVRCGNNAELLDPYYSPWCYIFKDRSLYNSHCKSWTGIQPFCYPN